MLSALSLEQLNAFSEKSGDSSDFLTKLEQEFLTLGLSDKNKRMTAYGAYVSHQALVGDFNKFFPSILDQAMCSRFGDRSVNEEALRVVKRMLPLAELTLWKSEIFQEVDDRGPDYAGRAFDVSYMPARPQFWIVDDAYGRVLSPETCADYDLPPKSHLHSVLVIPVMIEGDHVALARIDVFYNFLGDGRSPYPFLRFFNPQSVDDDISPDAGYMIAGLDFLRQPFIEKTQQNMVLSGAEKKKAKKWQYRPAVQTVALRAKEYEQHKKQQAEEEKRVYAVQFGVRGHYRNQPCGRGRKELRRVWVTEYVKGPEDAPRKPMLPQVNVARR